MNYYAVAELGGDGTWWISFPGRDGITSAADHAELIIRQAQNALASTEWEGGLLPPAIEDGAKLPTNLADFNKSAMVIVVPYDSQLVTVAAGATKAASP